MKQQFQMDLDPNAPMNATPFYKWLTLHCTKTNLPKADYDYALDFLKSLGFVEESDTITAVQFDSLNYIFQHWYDTTPYYGPATQPELFVTTEPTYYIQGWSVRWGITAKLKEMILKAGWIYEVSPDTTYFEVIDNRLYAKYQQIIGSRYLCELKG